ncbi:hypothetical protein [Nocardioides aurantiacus]|uniref:hypothetical protein n=1 Tax=Nocardioides aurantiacus TaxID=86796 RepID=UPI00403FA659
MRSRVRGGALTVLAGCLALAGCGRGQDDELTPSPTRTVTVTPSPTLQPPDRVPTGGATGFDDQVVWAQGNTLHVGGQALDLSPVAVEDVVATPTGAYVLARGELWSVDLQRAEGAGLPRVERVGLSRDGRSLLVDLAGDTRRRAYDVGTGRLVGGRAPAALTAAERRTGPGEYAVTAAADGSPEVTSATGEPVDVAGLPDRFEPRTWPTASTVAGLATSAAGESSVVSCSLAGRARCRTLGTVDGSEEVVFAVAALPDRGPSRG